MVKDLPVQATADNFSESHDSVFSVLPGFLFQNTSLATNHVRGNVLCINPKMSCTDPGSGSGRGGKMPIMPNIQFKVPPKACFECPVHRTMCWNRKILQAGPWFCEKWMRLGRPWSKAITIVKTLPLLKQNAKPANTSRLIINTTYVYGIML